MSIGHDPLQMAAFLYQCPATGFQVQGWVHDDEPDDGRETYEGVHCPACQRFQFANPKTGKVLGSSTDK
jgi:hypothetical protein